MKITVNIKTVVVTSTIASTQATTTIYTEKIKLVLVYRDELSSKCIFQVGQFAVFVFYFMAVEA